MTTRKRSSLLTAASAAIVAAAALTPAAGGYAATSTSGTTVSQLTVNGTTALASQSGTATDGLTNEVIPNFVAHQPKNPNLNHVSAAGVPSASNAIVGGQLEGFGGFNGLNHRNQRGAGTGPYANTQFSLEPPDQGLCVSGGTVLEPVNDALRVFDSSGSALSAPTALNQFFNLKPAVVRSNPPVFGDFVSDPKCYFDPADQRWFVSALQIGLDPATANFVPPTHLEIAVSQSADPTGSWNLFSIDTTDDGSNGTPSHANCPCFGDQPLIGADANGFYITTNEYGLGGGFPFNGAQVYAISKQGLESGSGGKVVHINAGPFLLEAGGLAFSIQPATAPGANGNELANGGTEYFVSDLDFTAAPALGTRANRLAVWALTNTQSLDDHHPSVSLSDVVINSELYVQPPNAEQKPGALLLGSILHNPLSLIAGNDDRMNQVVFADGKLWTGVNTALQTPNGPTRVGSAYFIVAPSDPAGTLSAAVVKQGYVAASQQNLLFPSIGVTAAGKGVITFTLVGPDFFPSAAYASIDAVNGVGDIHIAGAGQGPEDGFTGYDQFGGDVSRWGDYTAAVADGDSVWFATEYIAHPATDTSTRTLLANWATFVAHVNP